MYYDQTNGTQTVKTAAGYTQYLQTVDKSLAFVDRQNIQWEVSEEALPVHAVSMDGGSFYTIPYAPTLELEVST
eukprot:9216753-Ditylum_brightwellii.AAC.1